MSNTTKTIAFFVRNIDQDKPPFSSQKYGYSYFGYAYQDYLLALNQRDGVQAFFVSGNNTYEGNGRFSQSWVVDAVGEVKDFRSNGPIQASLVFEKGGFEGTGVTVVTDPRVRRICDKAETFKRFGQFQPKTVLCQNDQELQDAIASLPGDLAVVKNPGGSSGKQVYIGKKTELTVPADETYPLLVQEFVDMSEGVPGLAEGLHDFRVLVVGGEIIGATLRQPAPGRLHSNTGQGGTERLLSADQVPDEVRDMVSQIDAGLEDLPRYYSVDFARSKQGWRLIELNGKPGLYYKDDGPLAGVFRDKVVDYLVSLA